MISAPVDNGRGAVSTVVCTHFSLSNLLSYRIGDLQVDSGQRMPHNGDTTLAG